MVMAIQIAAVLGAAAVFGLLASPRRGVGPACIPVRARARPR